jgi:hypothetical protein
MARPQQRELARNEKVPGLSPDASETELGGQPELDDRGPTGPVPADNIPGHHPEEEQDKPDGAAFLAKMQGQDRPRKKSASAKKAATAKKARSPQKAPVAKKASAPVKKVGSPVEAAPTTPPAPAAPVAAAPARPAQSSTQPAGGIDLADVRDVAVKLAFWPITVGVWAGKQDWRRLQEP